MEVSSHALAQQRVFGVPFDVAIFTNLTRDHLDYHKSMEEYFYAKRVLFEGCGTDAPRAAVTNVDDEYGAQLVGFSRKRSSVVLSYGWASGDFHAENAEITPRGTRFDMITPEQKLAVFSPLIGRVNVYNILAASAACFARGCTEEAIANGVAALTHVPGRFQRVDCGQPFTVVVDYAHTDDALKNLTMLAREFVTRSGGAARVITLFGCGGDRDRAKRPLMGEAAGRGSDFVVLTSDNPRSEDPAAIINDAMVGLQKTGVKYAVEVDRRKAIGLAIGEARPGDIVLLAGKGHEKVQIGRDGSRPFDDVQVAQDVLKASGFECGVIARRGEARMKLSLSKIAEFISATGDFWRDEVAQAYSIDSRSVRRGELFFAVKGERLDGHDFVAAALEKGAVGAVICQDQAQRFTDQSNLLCVEDTLVALQTLATAVRKVWGKPLVGVTGSAGKTTTKEAIAHVLSSGGRVLKSEGNFNNHFGLPLMLLKLEPEHDLAVIEMGMSHAGEIRALAKIAQPEIGVVTNVAPVHLEFFDSIAGIARAKYELIESLPSNGIAVLNADDEYVSQFGRDFKGRVIKYGIQSLADVRAENVRSRGVEGSEFDVIAAGSREHALLQLVGEHNILNALAAVSVGLACGMKLPESVAALASLAPADKRGQVLQLGNITVVNDCYNSNPKALNAMVDALAAMKAARRIVVAGEMLELGAAGEEMHRDAGRYISERKMDMLLGVRGLAQSMVDGARQTGTRAEFVATPEEAGEWLARETRDGDVVLLKASRGVKLEKALETWKAKTSGQ